MKFIHTADWQLGKPFARVDDIQKRSLLQQERFEAIKRIGKLARDEGAAFVLVAGDLFDSTTPSRETVASACSAIGEIGIPVIAIPGNHDHGGPGSVWEQAFFQREHRESAPNLRVLLTPEPIELDGAIVFPCPLSRRAEAADTTAWLRSGEAFAAAADKPRVVLAHGSVQDFISQSDDDEGAAGAANRIDLARLPEEEIDYIALGDWHGTKEITPKAWYAGTPELDRFPKGGDYDAGNILVVELRRGAAPSVSLRQTARFGWHNLAFDFTDDASLSAFTDRLEALLGNRANQDLLHLHMTGSLGIEASAELERRIEHIQARLLRLKLSSDVAIAPTEEEVAALTQRAADPLVSRVAARLLEQAQASDNDAATARIALRELHAAVTRG